MSKKNDYWDSFTEDQNQQYAPWNYYKDGQPSPFDEAKGNPIPLAVAYIIIAGMFCFSGTFIAIETETIGPLILGIAICVFLVFVSIGYFRKAKRRKETSRKALRSRNKRKK